MRIVPTSRERKKEDNKNRSDVMRKKYGHCLLAAAARITFILWKKPLRSLTSSSSSSSCSRS